MFGAYYKFSDKRGALHKVSVVLPTYNEKDNIVTLIKEIKTHLNSNVEIIVVDDDSPDLTWQIVEDLKDDNVKLLRRMNEQCLTTAIWDGISAASGEVVVWMDTDLSMPPEKIPDLLKKIDEGYDVSVGSRYVHNGGTVIIEESQDSMLSAVSSFVLNIFLQKLLGLPFKDYTSGFSAARRSVFDDIKLRGDYGEYFIDLIYNVIKKGYKVIEIPYILQARKYGVSKTGSNFFQLSKRGLKYVSTSLRLRFTRIERSAPKN
jgi:dolichol-phosphate mannosyltransferase